MSNATPTPTPAKGCASPVSFIRFHGLNLLVLEHEGVEYVSALPLCNLAGMQWKGARRTLQGPENAALYGSRLLQRPVFDQPGTTSCPETQLHIRLDRARMFLARINTAHMASKGNPDGAAALLALQIEWADALHAYETHGMAIKKGHREGLSELMGLIKARNATTHAAERQSLTAMISDACSALGYPLEEATKQLALPGV